MTKCSKYIALVMGGLALTLASCKQPTGGDSIGESPSGGDSITEGSSFIGITGPGNLADTVWLYKDYNSSTTKPEPKPQPDQGGGSESNPGGGDNNNPGGGESNPGGGDNNNPGGGESNPGGGDNNNPGGGESNPGGGSGSGGDLKPDNPTVRKDFEYDYVYFDKDCIAYYGTVSWYKIEKAGKVIEESAKTYSPKYAGTYETNSDKMVQFNFTTELKKFEEKDIWISVEEQRTENKITKKFSTLQRTSSGYSVTSKKGLRGDIFVDVGNSSSVLQFSHKYLDDGYDAKQWWTWEKDTFGLDKAKLCANGSKAKFETKTIPNNIYISEVDENNIVSYYGFNDNKLASKGTLYKNNADFENYKNVLSIDHFVTYYDTTSFTQYDNTLYTACERERSSSWGESKTYLDIDKICSFSGTNTDLQVISDKGVTLKLLEKDEKIYGHKGDKARFVGKEELYNGYDPNFDPSSSILRHYKEYPDIYTESKINTYDSTKPWCYQSANFIGYVDGKRAIKLSLIKDTDSWTQKDSYYYQIEDILTGKTNRISAVLPSSFTAVIDGNNLQIIEVKKNPTSTSEGANLVDFTMNNKKYTLCFENVPYSTQTFDKNDDARILSLTISPKNNKGITEPIYANIDQTSKTISLTLPTTIDKKNIMFDYVTTAEKKDSTSSQKDGTLYYSNSETETNVENFIKFSKYFRDFGWYIGVEKQRYNGNVYDYVKYVTNSREAPNDITKEIEPYHDNKKNKDYKNSVQVRDESKQYSPDFVVNYKGGGLAPKYFLSETTFVETPDGRVGYFDNYKNRWYYMFAPTNDGPEYSYLTWKGYEYLKKVFIAKYGNQNVPEVNKDFKLSDYVGDRPTNAEMIWQDPKDQKPNTQNSRSITSGDYGYSYTDKYDNTQIQGYDFTKIKQIMVQVDGSKGKFSNIYKVIIN